MRTASVARLDPRPAIIESAGDQCEAELKRHATDPGEQEIRGGANTRGRQPAARGAVAKSHR
jgi:hypothetical protein